MTWLIILVCLLLMLVVLIQRGRGGGLSGAFGGVGGSSAFGAKTGDVFTWITVVVAAFFVVLAISANFVFDPTPTPAQASPVLESGSTSDNGNSTGNAQTDAAPTSGTSKTIKIPTDGKTDTGPVRGPQIMFEPAEKDDEGGEGTEPPAADDGGTATPDKTDTGTEDSEGSTEPIEGQTEDPPSP